MSLLTPLEAGLGDYMGSFYAGLVGTTPALQEFAARGLAKSIVRVPGRMVDDVQTQLEEWRKNDNEKSNATPAGKPSLTSRLPVILLGVAKDFTPVMADWGVAVGTAINVVNPADPQERMYKLRVSVNEYRAQAVIIAPEAATAHDLAMQFHLHANGAAGRRFKHYHEHDGQSHAFDAVLEQIDLGAMDAKPEQKNLTILIVDMNIRAAIPIFQTPADDRVIEVHGDAGDGVTWVAK